MPLPHAGLHVSIPGKPSDIGMESCAGWYSAQTARVSNPPQDAILPDTPSEYYETMRRMILCLALGLTLLAETPMTTLTISVKNDSGKGIEDASVVVRFIRGHSALKLGKGIRREWELHTNQEGIAKIPPIPQGTILIQVIAKNYQTFGDNFDVDEAQKTVEIKLKPPQAQFSAH
jgi:hypothetical protein